VWDGGDSDILEITCIVFSNVTRMDICGMTFLLTAFGFYGLVCLMGVLDSFG
jgi:hypothetical protein